MKLRKIVRNFFGFSRAETNGLLILLPLMIFVIFSEPLYRHWQIQQAKDFSADSKRLDSLLVVMNADMIDSTHFRPPAHRPFDPNKVDEQDLLAMGFSSLLAKRIDNYRKKGGRFTIKKDLLKMYGMDTALYESLLPYIQLPASLPINQKVNLASDKKKALQEKIKQDLNKADTAALKKIYGIGEKLSLRIVTYRNNLGGFIHENQLREVYGLDSLVVDRILKRFYVDQSSKPIKLNLNTATEEELSKHPYIRYKIAGAIVAYRFQHKHFQAIDDLLKIKLIDAGNFERMRPYLSVGE